MLCMVHSVILNLFRSHRQMQTKPSSTKREEFCYHKTLPRAYISRKNRRNKRHAQDKSHKIYYNAESWHKSENKEVRVFLKFLTTQATDTDLTKSIQSAVYTSRKNFMTLYEMIDEVKAVGREEGIAIGEQRGREAGILKSLERGSLQKAFETARNLLRMGLRIEQISFATGLPLESIQEIADEISAHTEK